MNWNDAKHPRLNDHGDFDSDKSYPVSHIKSEPSMVPQTRHDPLERVETDRDELTAPSSLRCPVTKIRSETSNQTVNKEHFSIEHRENFPEQSSIGAAGWMAGQCIGSAVRHHLTGRVGETEELPIRQISSETELRRPTNSGRNSHSFTFAYLFSDGHWRMLVPRRPTSASGSPAVRWL